MPRIGALTDVVALIAAAEGSRTIHAPSGLSQSAALITALQASPEAARDATFVGLFIPGVDAFDYSSLHSTTKMSTPLMAAHLREGFAAGRVSPARVSYREVYERLCAGSDVGVAVVTPGDGDTFGFGVAADAGPAALAGARKRVALVNEAAPRVPNIRTIAAPRDLFDLVVPVEEPLNWVKPETPPQGALARIAEQAAGLINDGDVLQFGIGKLPGAVLAHIVDGNGVKGLKIHSGLYSEGVMALLEAGALSDAEDSMTAGVALGSPDLAKRLVADPRACFRPVSMTHDPRVMARHDRFTAINGALQIDLFGQVNAEFVGAGLVSGPGGLPDFAAGANLAQKGRLIIGLPATAGAESRIVPRLTTPWVTLPRGVVDYVVTEFGVADIGRETLEGTAKALIAVAHPDHREALDRAWTALRASL